MACTIRLIGSACGVPTQHDGRYLVRYEPPRMDKNGEWLPGGGIETTADIRFAKRYADGYAAIEEWRKENGVRPDGKPNRPLTAWTIDIQPINEP